MIEWNENSKSYTSKFKLISMKLRKEATHVSTVLKRHQNEIRIEKPQNDGAGA